MAEYIKTNKYKIAASLIAIAICMFIARETYPALILAYIVIYSIGTTGLDLLFGFSGQISMGHAAFFAIARIHRQSWRQNAASTRSLAFSLAASLQRLPA